VPRCADEDAQTCGAALRGFADVRSPAHCARTKDGIAKRPATDARAVHLRGSHAWLHAAAARNPSACGAPMPMCMRKSNWPCCHAARVVLLCVGYGDDSSTLNMQVERRGRATTSTEDRPDGRRPPACLYLTGGERDRRAGRRHRPVRHHRRRLRRPLRRRPRHHARADPVSALHGEAEDRVAPRTQGVLHRPDVRRPAAALLHGGARRASVGRDGIGAAQARSHAQSEAANALPFQMMLQCAGSFLERCVRFVCFARISFAWSHIVDLSSLLFFYFLFFFLSLN
jgi:hypothetical protein